MTWVFRSPNHSYTWITHFLDGIGTAKVWITAELDGPVLYAVRFYLFSLRARDAMLGLYDCPMCTTGTLQ